MTTFRPVILAKSEAGPEPDRWYTIKGPCYFANKPDSHGDYVDPATLRRAVYDMMRRRDWQIDLMHDGQSLESCHLVESYFVEEGQGGYWVDGFGAELEVRPGDWITAIQVSPDIFAKVEAGEIGAFSFEGFAIPIEPGARQS